MYIWTKSFITFILAQVSTKMLCDFNCEQVGTFWNSIVDVDFHHSEFRISNHHSKICMNWKNKLICWLCKTWRPRLWWKNISKFFMLIKNFFRLERKNLTDRRTSSLRSFLAPKIRSTSWIQDDLISRISNVATKMFSSKSQSEEKTRTVKGY